MEVDPSALTEAGPVGAAAPELGPGATIGKYRLDRVLGAGGMGVVWAAFDPDLERAVAIKVLRAADGETTLRTRLLREARAMARVKHVNILTVYDVGTDRNRDFIAMELIDGADLNAWLVSRPPLDDVFAALMAAGRGLAAAHDAGLIHRDLKPHNILRGRDGSVYVTDFGLARGQIDEGPELVQGAFANTASASGSGRRVDSLLDSPLTQTGVLIGTPAYMAPEQFTGRIPDPRSDQFAFCVTAWEALTGARPFAGKSLDELRFAAYGGVRDHGNLSPRVAAVLLRGLAPEPEQRWPDMHVVLRELSRAMAPTPVVAWKRKARKPIFVSVGVGVTAIVAIAALSPHHKNTAATGAAAKSPGGDCEPADEEFDAAWNSERRKEVQSQHHSDVLLMAAVGMLDSARGEWIKRYDAACALYPSEARQDQLECLSDAREAIEEAVDELVESRTISLPKLVPLNIKVSMCNH